MRLLSALPLLLTFVSSIYGAPVSPSEPEVAPGGPTEAPEVRMTSIEIIWHNTSRIIIHEILPTLSMEDQIAAAKAEVDRIEREFEEAKASLARFAPTSSPTCNNEELAALIDNLEKIRGDLVDASQKLAELTGDGQACCSGQSVAVARDSGAAVVEEVTEPTTTTEAPITRICTCDESKACREESKKSMDTCMSECEATFEEWGTETAKFTSCFAKNNASILEAEECLFKDQTEKACKTTEKTDATNWESMEDIEFQPNTEIKDTDVWHKYQPKYNKIQDFFHCTKHCMHKKLGECTAEKKCNFKLPAHDDFAKQMTKCTKDNVKISNALLSTCTCLAWTENVKELQGTCGMIGNNYYISKA